MKVRIDIDTRTFVRFWLIVIGFVLALYLIYIARSVILLVGVSLFLALALNPPVSKITKRLPGRSRIGATALAYVGVVAVLGFVVFTVVPPVAEQTARFVQNVPTAVDSISKQSGFIDEFVEKNGLRDQYDQAIESAQSQAGQFASSAGSLFVNGIGAVVNGAVQTLLVLVLAFLMLIEGPTWISRMWALYRNQKTLKRHQELAARMYRVVTGYVNGQITVAAIAGVSATVAVLILTALFDLPASTALPVGALIFVTSLVPIFGAIIGAAVAAILIAFSDVSAALIFVVYFVVYQQIEGNLISPVIQSKAVELSALSILIGFAVGLTLLGPIGGILAIPITGCLRVLLLDYLEHNRVSKKSA